MKIGDLVKLRDRRLSKASAKEYLGHVGVIFEIRESQGKRNEVFVFINDKFASFLPRYLEVIS